MVRGFHRKSWRWRSVSITGHTRKHFLGFRFGTSKKSGIEEAQYLYSLPERTKLRSVQENQDYKGSLQEAHWRSSTSSRKVWWLDNSRSQSFQWRMWISKQSPIRSRGTRLSHSMDTQSYPRKTKISGDGKELTKVSRAVGKAESHSHWQFIEIWQSVWIIMESLYINTSPIGKLMGLLREQCAELGRDVCCIVAIGLGWNMVGWFHGMLLIPANFSRPPVRWENTLRTAIRRTIQRTNNAVWCSWISSDFCERPVQAPPIR